MSRGLGSLQRQILASLEAARAAQESHDRGWVLYQQVDMRLVEDVYDLRCVAAYLRRRGATHLAPRAFESGFSRAVHRLIQRGLLLPLRWVPLDDVRFYAKEEYGIRPFLSWREDRQYFHWSSRQTRFVKRQDNVLST